MESKKSGQAGIITALIAIILGSFVFVSAALTNSTNEALVIEFNESLNLTLVAVVSGITVNETTVNNITLENQTLENIASTNQSTINETINQTIPSINITPINQSINLTIPIDNSTLIINQTNLTLPINNATLNILLPKIKNLTKIVEDNKFKLNNETEAYLKNIKNKKEVREFIIKFKTSIDEAKLVNITLDRKINRFKLTKITGEIDDIEDLIEDAEIEFLELEQDINLLEEQIPFNVKKVNADNVWNLSNGSGIKVAVLDTGIWQHDDLILAGGVSIVSNNYYDSHGHGTKVAGVIAALLNNEGLVGVAPDVSLYPVKILHGSAGDLSDAIAGVEWVINNNMDIVSMSFGFSSYSQIFKEVLEEAYNNGILLVAASGNEGTDNILYPSKYSTVIAVGAVTENDDLAYFSSYGFEQELVAPGVDINSTSLSNTYSVSSGTSLAAPHVAGVAALIKSYNKSLTNEQIRAKLRNDALDLGQEGKDDIFGYGLVQVNLTSLNFTQANESYFYELFNITNFRLQNESYWFWLNGTGTIDDVDFEEGYYLVNITYNDGSKKSNIYNVSENGNIFILATAIEHFDYYIYDGSSNSDGIAWINDNITVKVTSTTVPTPEGECYWIDGGTNGRLNYCFFDTTTHKNECDSDPDITCGTETNCQVVSTLIDRYREIINYASARTGTSQARIYDDCTTPGSGIEESGTLTYYVINTKRWRCTGLASYVAEGWYGSAWVTIDTDSCQTGQVCVDSANITTKTYSINPCQLPTTQYCSGTISAIVADTKNNPLTNTKVYSNNVFNGSVDKDGNRLINYTSVTCGSSQSITIKCSDDTLCDTKSTSIDSEDDYDSLTFTCNVCINKTDLSIKSSDISIKSQGNKHNITALINVEKVTANNVKVDFRGQNLKSDVTQNESKIISVSQYQNQNVSVLWDLNKTDFVSITVDFANTIAETDESNNYIKKATRPLTKAYLDVNTNYSVLASVYNNFLDDYIDLVSQANAEVNIYVGRKNSNIPTGEQIVDNGKRWELKDNLVRFNSKREGLPYNGVAVKKSNNIYVFGNEIDGDIAALRKIVDNQEFYFSKAVTERIDYISEEDLDGIFVFDYLHSDEDLEANT